MSPARSCLENDKFLRIASFVMPSQSMLAVGKRDVRLLILVGLVGGGHVA